MISTTTVHAVSGLFRTTAAVAAVLGLSVLSSAVRAQDMAPTRALVSSVVRLDGFSPSVVSATLAEVARAHPDLALYSYPFHSSTGYAANLVVRGRSAAKVETVTDELSAAFRKAGVMRVAQAAD